MMEASWDGLSSNTIMGDILSLSQWRTLNSSGQVRKKHEES